MLTVILAPVLGVWYLFNIATEDFWNAYDYEAMGRECSMKYVGKQPVNPNAYSVPLTPPVGEPYILFRQVCDDPSK